MNYELKFDDDGELDGFQMARYEICGQKITECQLFLHGMFMCGHFIVFGIGSSVYCFKTEDWGTMDIAREAAETFAADENFNVVIQKGWLKYSFVVVPAREEALI